MSDATGTDPDDLSYGPATPGERQLRLLGPLEGRRVLLLGTRAPHPFVPLCRAGALVVAIEADEAHRDRARAARDRAEVRLELRHADLADLAFLKADSMDVALSVGALAEVEDLGRVFRQVHRVLAPQGAFVLALPHPTATLVDPETRRVVRSAFDRTPREVTVDGVPGIDRVHRIEDLFVALERAKMRVDTLLEPKPPRGDAMLPSTLVLRARKEGI